MRFLSRLAAIAALSCLASLAFAGDAKVVEHLFNTRVSVDAAGQVTDVELLQEVPAPLQALVVERARGIPFEPAMRDGQPVSSRTALQLGVRFTPAGEDYLAKITRVTGGSHAAVRTTAPRFPASVFRAGRNIYSVVTVRPRADGTADPETLRVDQLDFYQGEKKLTRVSSKDEREVRDALVGSVADWSFVLEEVQGEVITTEIRVPITLCIAKRVKSREGSEQICDQWREAIQQGLGRPEPVDAGVRLAQPKLDKPVAPTT